MLYAWTDSWATVKLKRDWVVIKIAREREGSKLSFVQLARVLYASPIVLATPLSVKEDGDYLVTPTDEVRKIMLFDEPRRAGNTVTYAPAIVDEIEKPANMGDAVAYFNDEHGIDEPDVWHAFEIFHKNFMSKVKRMDKASVQTSMFMRKVEQIAAAGTKRKRPFAGNYADVEDPPDEDP